MGYNIRQATPADAPQWLDLVQAALGPDYPAKEIYDLAWIAGQLDPKTGHETWVVDVDGRLHASTSFLKQDAASTNPIANLGRNFIRAEGFADGSGEALLRSINQLAA